MKSTARQHMRFAAAVIVCSLVITGLATDCSAQEKKRVDTGKAAGIGALIGFALGDSAIGGALGGAALGAAGGMIYNEVQKGKEQKAVQRDSAEWDALSAKERELAEREARLAALEAQMAETVQSAQRTEASFIELIGPDNWEGYKALRACRFDRALAYNLDQRGLLHHLGLSQGRGGGGTGRHPESERAFRGPRRHRLSGGHGSTGQARTRRGGGGDACRTARAGDRLPVSFAHEKLDAYRLALQFVSWVHSLRPQLFGQSRDVRRGLDETCTTVPLNIAAGCCRCTAEDRQHFFADAHEAAMQCTARLDVLARLRALPDDFVHHGKQILARLAAGIEDLIDQIEDDKREPVAIHDVKQAAGSQKGERKWHIRAHNA